MAGSDITLKGLWSPWTAHKPTRKKENHTNVHDKRRNEQFIKVVYPNLILALILNPENGENRSDGNEKDIYCHPTSLNSPVEWTRQRKGKKTYGTFTSSKPEDDRWVLYGRVKFPFGGKETTWIKIVWVLVDLGITTHSPSRQLTPSRCEGRSSSPGIAQDNGTLWNQIMLSTVNPNVIFHSTMR